MLACPTPVALCMVCMAFRFPFLQNLNAKITIHFPYFSLKIGNVCVLCVCVFIKHFCTVAFCIAARLLFIFITLLQLQVCWCFSFVVIIIVMVAGRITCSIVLWVRNQSARTHTHTHCLAKLARHCECRFQKLMQIYRFMRNRNAICSKSFISSVLCTTCINA